MRMLAANVSILLLITASATYADDKQKAAEKVPEPATIAATTPAADRVELDVTAITGSRELPKVMYIVPWKESDLGDIAGRPVNSLLDEALSPLDREVFLRQVNYFGQLYGEPKLESE
jgi:hypothetical protein